MVASNGGQAVTSLQQLTSLHNDYTALPATATHAERRRIIRAMIALIRQDPSLLAQLADQGLGDAPSLGDVRPHRGQPPRFQPRGGSPSYAALWELESEHVIPQSYVNALFAAFSLSAVSTSEYRGMHTVLIYKGAADVKTEGAGGDNTVYRTLTEAAREVMEVAMASSNPAAHFDAAMGTILRLFESYASNAIDRTFEAIVEEHAKPNGQSTNGDIRKRPAGAGTRGRPVGVQAAGPGRRARCSAVALTTARRHARLDERGDLGAGELNPPGNLFTPRTAHELKTADNKAPRDLKPDRLLPKSRYYLHCPIVPGSTSHWWHRGHLDSTTVGDDCQSRGPSVLPFGDEIHGGSPRNDGVRGRGSVDDERPDQAGVQRRPRAYGPRRVGQPPHRSQRQPRRVDRRGCRRLQAALEAWDAHARHGNQHQREHRLILRLVPVEHRVAVRRRTPRSWPSLLVRR